MTASAPNVPIDQCAARGDWKMTIACIVKVNDGFVLAADSATTVSAHDGEGAPQVVNIYNNANKIFNLHKALPIGAMTWGLGNVGPATISTLTKDLRLRFSGRDKSKGDWELDPDGYTMAEVADRVKVFLYDEKYQATPPLANGPNSWLGFLVGGYSAHADQPEVFSFLFGQAGGDVPTPVLPDAAGTSWFGQPEAITRLVMGASTGLPAALVNLGVEPGNADQAVAAIHQQLQASLVSDAMPIRDAIDFAEFLVDVTIKFVRFSPGHATVGGPIELASITKHEGFKWIARKHFYGAQPNPREDPPWTRSTVDER